MTRRRAGNPLLWLMLVAFLLRAQTFGNPVVEFDEQYYLLVGDRMLSGALPYADIWDRKPIGLFLLFAAMRWIGGLFGTDGLLASQIITAIIAAGTAECIRRMARLLGALPWGGIIAALAYLLWLNLAQGEGSQASVLYNLPVAMAALLLLQVILKKGAPAGSGLIAMLLFGLAIQIKYSVVFEGALFGLWLIAEGHRRGWPMGKLALWALLWATAALLPTLAALACYAAMGETEAFLFTNFQSQFLRAPAPFGLTLEDMAGSAAIMALPIGFLIAAVPRLPRSRAASFMLSWLLTAAAAILLLRGYSPHYFIPLLLPLLPVAAFAFDRRRLTALVVCAIAAIAGQALLAYYEWSKGGRREAEAMVEAIGAVPHCLYVHDGYPALYRLTGSCLPTPFAFPGSLNMADEAHALGIDSAKEVQRILASRPDTIVTDLPAYPRGNAVTRRLVEEALTAHYRLALKLETGKGRYRLVYRRRDAAP